jgi:hypothetical protein
LEVNESGNLNTANGETVGEGAVAMGTIDREGLVRIVSKAPRPGSTESRELSDLLSPIIKGAEQSERRLDQCGK